jgi:NADH-quinone oxidoreductase subunit N
LAKNQPILGLVMTVFLLAQAGMPLTSGFVAKFGVIQSAVAVGSYQLAVIAMVCAVIAAFVYLRIMVSMWLSDSAKTEKVSVPMLSRVAIGLAVAFTLLIGFLPSLILDLTSNLAELATK